MCVCISCAIRTRQTRPPPLHPLRVFQRLRVVLRDGRRGAPGMERKILRHVRRFLRGLVILKRHRADYYICSQFQVLLKHSVVPLAHVYAGLDLSVKKRKKRKKKRKDIRFIRAHTIGGRRVYTLRLTIRLILTRILFTSPDSLTSRVNETDNGSLSTRGRVFCVDQMLYF